MLIAYCDIRAGYSESAIREDHMHRVRAMFFAAFIALAAIALSATAPEIRGVVMQPGVNLMIEVGEWQ
jgi:hypothetical protein